MNKHTLLLKQISLPSNIQASYSNDEPCFWTSQQHPISCYYLFVMRIIYPSNCGCDSWLLYVWRGEFACRLPRDSRWPAPLLEKDHTQVVRGGSAPLPPPAPVGAVIAIWNRLRPSKANHAECQRAHLHSAPHCLFCLSYDYKWRPSLRSTWNFNLF